MGKAALGPRDLQHDGPRGPRSRYGGGLALGTWLAARGMLSAAAFGIAVIGALASVAVAVVVGRGGSAAATQLPTAASSVIAWGAGTMLAFGAALRATRRDREEGLAALARARGLGTGAYVAGRVGGLVVVIAIAVGGATLVAGIAALSVTRAPLPTARACLAAIAYALAFSMTIGPVAMAALGTRTRAGGYFTLLLVLGLPELLAPWSAALLPRGWHELTSIPAALDAIRNGVASPVLLGAPAARAMAGLVAVVAVSLFVVAAGVRSGNADGTP